ncbi:MAG: HlyD family efflux transporter periplasmic adaptor subunit [Bergeyella sp.]
MDKLDEIELRSESVQDILTAPPHWMIRWGNSVIFIILLMILLMSYFIKYPEFVPAPIIVTSQNPPEKFLLGDDSKIEKIFVKNHQEVKKNDILMTLKSLQNEQSEKIISSMDGIVSFQQFLAENQMVKSGTVIMSVFPKSKGNLIGIMLIPAANSGKIKQGQKVLIKLDNYRYQEFGIIKGKVKNISLTTDEKGNYYIEVILPKNLKTSYNKQLPFDKELKGNAEIVTEDLRLMERFFYQIRELLGHQN